jgi:hypothetical protein
MFFKLQPFKSHWKLVVKNIVDLLTTRTPAKIKGVTSIKTELCKQLAEDQAEVVL